MEKRILVDNEKCDGCGLCQLACALERAGFFDPSLARIKIKKDKDRQLSNPVVCNHCIVPICQASCLMNIIRKDQATGLTLRDEAKCFGCRACQIACPFDACRYDYLAEKVTSCDLCQGQPSCVAFCPTGALRYEKAVLQPYSRRLCAASSLIPGE